MKRVFGLWAAVIITGLSGPALAQSASYQQNSAPSANNVSSQFQSGANRVGQGATQIGEGIKQGAILTWDALRDGAHTVAAKFNGG